MIFWGLAAAVILRVILATLAAELLAIIGLMFAGGSLLLWVCWKLYRDIREATGESKPVYAVELAAGKLGKYDTAEACGTVANTATVRRAIVQIAAADLSMSLDNVLAVAGAARNHVVVLAIGLVLSIGLMGVAANVVARVLNRYPWISYAGLFIVLYVALNMIFRGAVMLWHTVPS